MRTVLLAFVLILVASVSYGQSDSTRQVIQFSGLVVQGDSLSPVSFTTVYRQSDQRGTITDNLGFFSLPAMAGDTVHFSSIGYLPARYVIPDTLSTDRYNIVQLLGKDTVQIETTYIYPWPTKERFRNDFLALEMPNSKEELAKRNLEAAQLYQQMKDMGMSSAENYRYAIQQEAQKISYAGSIPSISLMNPIAWGQFIKAWRDGKLKRQ